MITIRTSPQQAKKIRAFSFACIVGVGTLFLTNLGWAYEEIENFSGQHLTGVVKIQGKIPNPRRYNLVLYSDPFYCGRISDGKGWRIAPQPTLGTNHQLSGAVVFLREVQRGKPFTPTTPVIETKNCVYRPYIHVSQMGQTYHFQNWDPVLHKLEVFLMTAQGAHRLLGKSLQPHASSRKSHFLSENPTAVHRSGPEVLYRYPDRGILVFRCQLHDFMEGWSVVLPHPYFSITDDRGQFSIQDIPPGTYSLVVWHPLGTQESMIEIGTEHRQDVDLVLVPTRVASSPEEPETSNPFGIDLVGDSRIVPSVELQQYPARGSRNKERQP